jgi:hypothetical protein
MSIDTRARRAADGVHASARGVDPMTQIVDLKREVKTRQRTGMVLTAAVVVVIVLGAFAASTRWLGTDESAPPAAPSVTDEARQVAAGFLQAYGSYDADRALSYLTDQALSPQWLTPEGLRDELAWNEAVGWTELRSPCERLGTQGATVDLRCPYTVHALGSEQLGRGPYGGRYWDLQVRDGKIVSARAEFPFESNGFSVEMWEPFVDFVDMTFPGDGDVMYTSEDRTDPQSTPESLRLWEQHISDYVASVKTS